MTSMSGAGTDGGSCLRTSAGIVAESSYGVPSIDDSPTQKTLKTPFVFRARMRPGLPLPAPSVSFAEVPFQICAVNRAASGTVSTAASPHKR